MRLRTHERILVRRNVERTRLEVSRRKQQRSSPVEREADVSTYTKSVGSGMTVVFSWRKHRLRKRPFHSCTPMMPKMKKTKKHRRRTLPSMGNVSSSSMTRMRIEGTRLMARSGRSTLTVRMADRLRLSPGNTDSTNLNERDARDAATGAFASRTPQAR
jgi:hypothetical protein